MTSISEQNTHYRFIINGESCDPSNGIYDNVKNPSTGKTIAKVAMGNEVDVDRAVVAARKAFENKEWRYMPPNKRAEILQQCAQLIAQNAQELALLEISCSGGTINRVAGLDILAAVDLFMSMAETVKTFSFVESLPATPIPEMVHTQVWKEPIGVCGLITAWNYPILLCLMKLAPALAAGNTIIIKPAEITPTSTIRLVEILQQVLPKGVVNVIVGPGSVVGEAMSLHPDIDKISFTGSTAIGKRIQQNAAHTLKRVTLELGGKGPAIVRPGVDLNFVADGALWGVYLNAGQVCVSGTRLIVHEDIYDELIKKLIEHSSRVVVGNPMNPTTGMGPMSTEVHFNKVIQRINDAEKEGARIVCGGKRAVVEDCEGGFFIEPTIIIDVTNDMKIAREEIFGPVLSVIKYSELDEAIAIANDSNYGLSAGVWTTDLIEAQRISRELRAGSIWINDWHMARSDAPFGGFKQSGYGRELGCYGLESYLEIKMVSTAFERDTRKKPMHRIVHTQPL